MQNKPVEAELLHSIWTRPLTNGRPLFSPYYVGDYVSPARKYFFRFTISMATWDKAEVGFGQADDGVTGWIWNKANSYQKTIVMNFTLRANIADMQFTRSGDWYVCGRVRETADAPFSYTVCRDWSENKVFSVDDCSSFIVNALNNPSAPSVSVDGTIATLTCTPQTLSQQHHVLVVRHIAGTEITAPVNGISYPVGYSIGGGTVVHNGDFTVGVTDNGLDYNTNYVYYFYSQNNNHYSSGVFVPVRTELAPTIDVIPSTDLFNSEVGKSSVIHAFMVRNTNVLSEIKAIAPKNYLVSFDNIAWAEEAIINSDRCSLYVKYQPTEQEWEVPSSVLLVSPSSTPQTINVKGSSHLPDVISLSTEATLSAEKESASGSKETTKPSDASPSQDNWFFARVKPFVAYAFIFIAFILSMRVFELSINQLDVNIHSHFVSYTCVSLLFDLLFYFSATGCVFILAGVVSVFLPRVSKVLSIILFIILTLAQFLLIKYFSEALNPLGADVFQYSLSEIKQTLGPTISLSMGLTFFSAIVIFIAAFVFLPRIIKVSKSLSLVMFFLFLIGFGTNFIKISYKPSFGSEYDNSLALNKSTYFYKAVLGYLFPQPERDIFDEMSDMFADQLVGKGNEGVCANDFAFKDDANYPFLHVDSTKDVLSPFLNKETKAPNIVMIVVEGLGRAFTNENAYLGNFTPFIDSLSQHSLYWENCLSTAGRTFGVMPSVLGSLPYGQHGFAELGEQMPSNLSLINVLGANGYHSSFYYAGDSKFDNMNLFMKRQNINQICDESTFDASYKKLPTNAQGFTWGYGDFELFRRCLTEQDKHPDDAPQIKVLLTVATHSPFKVNNQEKYDALFEQRVQYLKLDATTIAQRREYKAQFASILYMDDALRHFFKAYASRPSFKNTIFIITGDHRMPDIPMSTKIDRYHVPLIVYSPLLKRTAKFSAVVSHLDITPSLLAYVKSQYHFKSPSLVTWVGAGLDTARNFRNRNNYPLIPTKQGVSEYLSGNYMLSGNDLFQLSENMGLEPIADADKQRSIVKSLLEKFVQRNERMITRKTMLPDSLLSKFKAK